MGYLIDTHIFLWFVSGDKKLPNIHGDPFDRLIISQVISEKLILLSVDETLRNYKMNIEWT